MAGLLLAACQTGMAQAPKPAVLSNPGPAVRQELEQVILELSGFSSVLLSDSDLTQSSELVVQRRPKRDQDGGLLQGRDLELPQRFQLLKVQGHCWLLHRASERQRLLQQARCRDLDPAP